MKLLHIDSSVLGPHSVSRQLSSAIVAKLREQHPALDVAYRDLSSTPLSHLSGLHLAAAQGATASAELQEDLAVGQAVLDEFLAADIVVLGAPMYNFTIPSQLKAWIDRIMVAGKTFKYGAQGAEGLAGGKRVIVAISRSRDCRRPDGEDCEPGRRAHGGPVFIGWKEVSVPDALHAEQNGDERGEKSKSGKDRD